MRVSPAARISVGARASGFTLIELIISSALMTMIIASAYVCLSSAMAGQKLVETRENVFQNARVAMALMTADLRLATPLSKEFEFLGMRRSLGGVEADNLDFATLNFRPRGRNEGDFCEVSYFVNQDEQTRLYSLWRRRDPTADPEPLKGGSRELIAEGVAGLRLEYYDGWDWHDEWGDPTGKKRTSQAQQYNIEGLPEAVRITLWMDSNPKPQAEAKPGSRLASSEDDSKEPPLVFQTVVRLNLAQAAQPASSGSAASSGSNAGQSQPQTRGPPQ